MENRLPIRSRAGNLVLLVTGFAFVLSASAILIYAIYSTWGFAGPIDRFVQMVLVGCAAFGIYLVLGARQNLGSHPVRFRNRTAN